MSGRGNRGRGPAGRGQPPPATGGRGNQPARGGGAVRGGGGNRGGHVQPSPSLSPSSSSFPPMPQAAAVSRLGADLERNLTFPPSSSSQIPATQQHGPAAPRPAHQQQGPPPQRPVLQQQGPPPQRPLAQQRGPPPQRPVLQQQGPATLRPPPQQQGPAPPRPVSQQPGPGPQPRGPPAVAVAQTPAAQPTAVVQSQAPVSSKSVRPPQRPGFGTIGRKVVVRANHFLVQVADTDLNHYDVSISPEVLSKNVCRQIMNQLVESFGASHLGKKLLAYDGRKSCYTAGELPFSSKDFVVKLEDSDRGGSSRREREFKVSIKHASKADLHHLKQFMQRLQHDCPHETLQSLDVVLRHQPSNFYTVVGRSFFHPKLGNTGELGSGLDYWKGFYQSLRPTQMGLSLNIDTSARAFYEPIFVTEFVRKYFNRDLNRPLSDQDRLKLKRALKGVRVEVNYTGGIRRHKITGFSTEPAQQLMFSLEDGTTISVVQYYRQKYNIVLKNPTLPAIQAGSSTRSMYLPMELCRIVEGQRYTKKLNDRQVTAMLNATCQRPADREASIVKMVEYNNYNADEIVQQFGISVDPRLTSIDARVLPPPTVKYHESGKKKSIEPSVGAWNMIDAKMINPATVDYWTCINFSKMHLEDVEGFCGELIGMCTSRGMRFNPNPIVPFRQAQSNQIPKSLTTLHSEVSKALASQNVSGRHLQLLIVILPDFSGSYGTIKRVCETELGIVSQCCQPRQASKYSNQQYWENVSLKINVKVGGRNSALVQSLNGKMFFGVTIPTIVFGADVTHPQPGEDSSASIAAVVASMDWPQVTKYRGLVSSQAHREEIIQDLFNESNDPVRGLVRGGMIREHLIAFYKANNHTKPHRIIFYRDGVSEGQFSQVLLHEVDAIRKACASLEEGYMPRMTFVVVQKRHHTRLFPARHGDRASTDKSGNILPGTVIDTKICHPREFDFYLCSHAGIKGTSRPAHYHVLYDENGFTADHLQGLTNALCYTYARCTRSVSIVPPAYYAHLAAYRARYYIEGLEMSDSGSTSAGAAGGASTRERNVLVRALPKIKDNVKEVMFYC